MIFILRIIFQVMKDYSILVKKDNNDITRNDIKLFIEKQKEHQILKVQHNIKTTGRLVAFAINEIWQMDIFVLQKYEKQNKGYS